ncbi:MAG: hypothetical protein WED10_03025 [Brumimicrobium sp.]
MNRLLLFAFWAFAVSIYSQETQIDGYETVYQGELIQVSVAKATHVFQNRSHVRVFIKYTNLSDSKVKISLQKELHYGDRCSGCDDDPEQSTSLVLPPKTTLEFDENNTDKRFYIFVKDNDGFIKSQLTDFKLKNYKITLL